MTLFFLQNAWSPRYAHKKWPRKSWLRALRRSRSGKRLILLTDDFNAFENTTPIVSQTPDGKPPCDLGHMLSILKDRRPSIVVACGRQAESALLQIWEGSLLSIPHPASRLLTNELYREARRLLDSEFSGRAALRQRKGKYELIEILEGTNND